MRILIQGILWPIVFWARPSRVFMRVVSQAVAMGAPARRLVLEWRYFMTWRDSLRPGRNPIDVRRPWLTFQAIDWLSAHLEAGAKVFEYGGGGSTLFFLDRGAVLTTVEHDPEWFDLLRRKVADHPAWTGNLVPPRRLAGFIPGDSADPLGFSTSDERLREHDFQAYAETIRNHPDAAFDLICVDGRARPACLALAIPKLRRGGLLILDNAERETYARAVALCREGFEVMLDAPGSVPSCRWPSQTIIWKKL